ncbi:MAG TPA: YceI family protein [Sediminibacterium sp.]|nr:YceI family protein [Sediminibacterium sp.]
MHKALFLLILLFVLSGFIPPDGGRAIWVVLQGSSLTVKGSTNINTFQCVIPNYSLPDTISLVRSSQKGVTLPMNGKLNLSVEDFDCHNKMMTSDLRKTLKAKTYPVLTVRFVSVNGFPDLKNPGRITGIVDIGLAGVTKRFEINYLFSYEERQQIQLKGDQLIHFSDFNLTPPSKLGGVIKAKDELKVEFILHLKPQN